MKISQTTKELGFCVSLSRVTYINKSSPFSPVSLAQALPDKILHLGIVGLHTQEKVELVVGPHEVVIRVLTFPVFVARKIVPEEAHTLHVGEEGSGIRQVFYFYREQEGTCAGQIPFGKSLEDVHTELNGRHVGIVLSHGISRGTQKITIVGEDKIRHDGIEVDNAKYLAPVVEHHIVYLRVTMAHTLGQYACATHALGLGHLMGTGVNLLQEPLHTRLADTIHGVFGYDFAQLLETKLQK